MDKKVVVVTGGSRGIGAASARLFAQKGFLVCINYSSNDFAAMQLQKALNAELECTYLCKADVSTGEGVERLFNFIDNQLGRIDVLVNNVGILKPQASLIDIDEDRINQILRTNVTSQLLCAKAAVSRMSTSYGGSGGAIVNVSSGAAKSGSPNEYIDYAASKGAIDSFTIGLAKEVANQGIRVNCVRPGMIHTAIHADGGEPERVTRLSRKIPLQRGGQPAEVANAIYWLASEEAAYTTGSFIDVTGGL
ncbi:oxidoreductase [Agaribacter marinus]|uniref:Oxidoreductase n=2 Tax=Agaribacter marinus TaxID=1431249 RepID=A0AA37SZX1_9ALTE|nr:oxidoreductase [Agaribacter marinus]